MKPDTLNLIEEKMGNSFELIDRAEDILNRTPLSQALRSTINKWDLIKLRTSVYQRTLSFEQSGSLQNEKILANIHPIEA